MGPQHTLGARCERKLWQYGRLMLLDTNQLNRRHETRERLTTPSSATPGRGRGCEHAGARRRRGLCRASWRAAQPVTEPAGPKPHPKTQPPNPRFATTPGYASFLSKKTLPNNSRRTDHNANNARAP